MAAEQVEAVQPAGAGVEEVVADKGYHSDETLVALGAVGVRSHVSEPERGRRCWQDKKTGETPPEKRAAQKALYANRRRVRGRRGRRLQRCRGEVVERTFAHMYETGGMRRVWVRGHENVRKRVLLQAAACNIGLLLRSQTGIGTPRSLQGRAVSAICRLIGRFIDRWGRLTRAWGSKWTPATLAGSIAHRQSCLNSGTQRTDFFHGLLWALHCRKALLAGGPQVVRGRCRLTAVGEDCVRRLSRSLRERSKTQVDRPGDPGAAGGVAWRTSMGSSRRIQDGRTPPGVGEVINSLHVPVMALGTPPQRAAGQRLEAVPVVDGLPAGLLCRWRRRGVSSNRRHSASFCWRLRLARKP